jgi:hypothetical protein
MVTGQPEFVSVPARQAVTSLFAAFGRPEAGTLNSLSREVPVERAAELQAQHRGDLVELESAA